jgi:recombination protein RecA
MFGNPETTTGGNALKFYASVRLDVRRLGAIKNGEDVVGSRTAVKVVKNKMAPPFAKVEFDLMFGEGISAEGDILDLAAKYEIVQKSGAWYSYKDERIGQGRENTIAYFKQPQNHAMLEEIRQSVLNTTIHKDKLAAKAAAGAKTIVEKPIDKVGKDAMANKAAVKKEKH